MDLTTQTDGGPIEGYYFVNSASSEPQISGSIDIWIKILGQGMADRKNFEIPTSFYLSLELGNPEQENSKCCISLLMYIYTI